MTDPVPKLQVSHLQAGYGDVQVLWDISLEVATGELVCLIGSNGAGKTTLMRCISGLLAVSSGDDRGRRPRHDAGLAGRLSCAPASRMCRRAAGCFRR